jgi:hypothetical protein
MYMKHVIDMQYTIDIYYIIGIQLIYIDMHIINIIESRVVQ